jgi:hypothetical protein
MSTHSIGCDFYSGTRGTCSCRSQQVDTLLAELAQARGSKESAMAMSEQNLARALRAEEALAQATHGVFERLESINEQQLRERAEQAEAALVAAKNETLKTLLAERDNHGMLLTNAFEHEKNAEVGRQLLEVLGTVCGEHGTEGAVECAKRIIKERDDARAELTCVYSAVGVKGDDRCPEGVSGAMTVNRNAIRLQRERAERADQSWAATETRLREDLHMWAVRAETAYDAVGVTGSNRCNAGIISALERLRAEARSHEHRADKAEASLADAARAKLDATGFVLTPKGALHLAEENVKLLQDERRELVEKLNERNLLVNEYLTKAEKNFMRAEKLQAALDEHLCGATLNAEKLRAEKAEGERDAANRLVSIKSERARLAEDRLQAICSKAMDASFNADQNEYRMLVTDLFLEMGWADPCEVAKLKASAAMVTASLDQLKANGWASPDDVSKLKTERDELLRTGQSATWLRSKGWADPDQVAKLKAQATSTRVGDAIQSVTEQSLRERIAELEALNDMHIKDRDVESCHAHELRQDLDVSKDIAARLREERTEALRILNSEYDDIGHIRGDKSALTPQAALRTRDELRIARHRLAKAEETRRDSDAVVLYRQIQARLDGMKHDMKEFRPPSLRAL